MKRYAHWTCGHPDCDAHMAEDPLGGWVRADVADAEVGRLTADRDHLLRRIQGQADAAARREANACTDCLDATCLRDAGCARGCKAE